MYMVKPKSAQSKQKIADTLRSVKLEKENIPSTLSEAQESEQSTSTVVSDSVTSANTEMLEDIEESQAETSHDTVKHTRKQKSVSGKGKSKKKKQKNLSHQVQ